MFHKILVPLDGSPEAEQALGPAVRLAKSVEGEIYLLRNMKLVYMMMPAMAAENNWVWPEYSREQSRQETRDYLDGIAGRIEQPGISVHVVAVEGDTAASIVDTAVSANVNLIVMSAKGWSTSKVREMGSITERVLYSAACPVLIARKEGIQRIAVTLDGSLVAEHALVAGLAAAKGLHATLSLLRVSEPLGDKPLPREMAESYLQSVAGGLDYPARPFVIEGPVVDSILEFARLHGIDLLVMSTHGRSGMRRWLYGSVAARVMRACQSSMLIVRPPTHELS
jgi:nucleotide-binding universal stress UspA family protein